MQRREKDKRRHVKITTLLMLDGGFTPEQIAFTFGIDVSTIYRYVEKYRASNLGDYLHDAYTAYEGKLTVDQLGELEAELRGRLYSRAADICAWIRERFGVVYTPSGVVPLLKRRGFVYKKTRQVPAKADPEAQEAFLARLDELLKGAEHSSAGDSVYFCDAVHPQHNTRPSWGWIAVAEEFTVKSTPGRHRVNINGALNALDVTKIVVRTDDRIDAESAIRLFKQLQKRQPKGLIHVICDNARYYHSQAVRQWAERSRVRLVFLPGYSPNLNLIERLWKYMRRTVIDAIYYPTKEKFREGILGFFTDIKRHRAALESLLTLNFHLPSISHTS